MKRVVRLVLISVVALVAIGIAAVLVSFYVLHPKYRPAPSVRATVSPETIARGKYLAHSVTGCVTCHTPVDESRPGDFVHEDQLFSGREFPVVPEMIPGRLIASNLTPDRETGIGSWTDGELVRAIREGVSRDGRALFPMMPYQAYRLLTDEDTLAIIAYLRSVPAIRQRRAPSQIDFPVSMFIRAAPQPLDRSPSAWSRDPLKRGEVLLKVMGCSDCHTPMDRGTPIEGMHLAGGARFPGPFGVVYARNITSHPAAGIGSFTDEDLMRVFREGRDKQGRLLWVMPWSVTEKTTDEDLHALIVALRRVPPNPNLVPPNELRAQ